MGDERRERQEALGRDDAYAPGSTGLVARIVLTEKERSFLLALQEENFAEPFVYGPAYQEILKRNPSAEFRMDINRMITAGAVCYGSDPARSYEWPWATEEEMNQRIKETRTVLGLDQTGEFK